MHDACVVLAILVFAGVKIVPVYFAIISFRIRLRANPASRSPAIRKKTRTTIRDDIWKKAQELGIPAKQEDIHVAMRTGSVNIALDYSVPIDLAVYQFILAISSPRRQPFASRIRSSLSDEHWDTCPERRARPAGGYGSASSANTCSLTEN